MSKNQLINRFLEQSEDIIWMVDSNFHLVYGNQAYLSFMKEASGQDIKLNTSVFAHGAGESYTKQWKAYYTRGFSGESFDIKEDFHSHTSNKVLSLHIALKPIIGDDGHITAVACQATKNNTIGEQKYEPQHMVDASLDVFCTLNSQGEFVYVSDGAKRNWGYSPEELIGTSVYELILEEDISSSKNIFDAIVNGKEVKSFSNRYTKKDTTIAYNLWSGTWDTTSQEMHCVARDAEELIEEKQHLKLLESVITHANDAVLITEAEPVDEPGPRIIYVNEAFTKMTGYTSEEVIGKTPRILQGPKSDRKELARLSQSLRKWESCEVTTINYKKNGEEFWINFKVTPVADENGWFTHWVAIERDVTAQKNKELENKLLANISHHFSTSEHYGFAIDEVCTLIGKFGAFDWVEFWAVKEELNQIQLFSHYLANPEAEAAYKPGILRYNKSEGLVGKVWATETPVVWDENTKQSNFTRIEVVQKTNINAVIGLPLRYKQKVVGVLKVGTTQQSTYLNQYSSLFTTLESFIGPELHNRKLENDLNQLFHTVPDILCLFDLEGRLLSINSAGCNLLGYTPKEVLHHKLDEFVFPADVNIGTKKLKELDTLETVFEFENRCLTKSGEVIWLLWHCNISREEGLIYATAKDVTEERSLKELNRQVGILAKIGSWEVDLVAETVFWSEEVHQLHGTDSKTYTPNLEEGINFYREDFREMVRSQVGNTATTGDPWDFEAVIVTTNKKELWIRSIGSAEFVDGECIRLYGGFQDISHQKESETRLMSLSHSLPGIIYEYHIYPDGTDTLKHISGKVEEIWGFKAEEVLQNIGLVWEQVQAGGQMEELQESIRKSIETKTQWQSQIKYVLPTTGELRTHIGFGTPRYLTDGTIIFNSVILDITKEAENEVLLEQTSKMARIGSWEMNITSQDGDSMYWSAMVRSILGVDQDYEATLQNKIAFFKDESNTHIQQAIDTLISKGTYFDDEFLIQTNQGDQRWVRVIGNSIKANDQIVRIYGTIQDIHPKKTASLELEKSIKSLRDYKYSLDQSAIIAFTDQRGVITSANNNFCEISGYSSEELIGSTHQLVNSDHHPKDFFVTLWKTISSGKVWRGEIKNKSKDGTYYWVDTTIVPFLDDTKKPTQYLAIRFDITLRKHAEENIRQANERFEKVTEATNDAIWDWDMIEGTFYRSHAIERFFGEKVSTFIQEKDFWKDSFHPDDIDKVRTNLEEAIANPLATKWKMEYRILNKDRGLIYVIDQGVIVRNEQGKAIRMVGAMTDITEETENKELLLKYTKELERSNEELEQFAYVASHDLQEPLRMVSSFMGLLQRKYGDKLDEKGHQYVDFAIDGAKRMKNLILDLLEYSRAGKTSEEAIKEVVDVHNLLFEFEQLRRKVITEKNATLVYGKLPKINSFKAPITQILHCLLDNAMHYSKEGTPPIIEIDLVENTSDFIFSVKDNGIGINPKFHDKIFMIFQRLHNNEKYTGTGIGLSVASRLVEYLGGKIWLESEEGVGSTFYFSIPKKKTNNNE